MPSDPPMPWSDALRTLRPGSRTVLYLPPDQEPVMELARRGFRLLVIHPRSEFCRECRDALRQSGLSSQLMGSHQPTEGKPLKLAESFYDLVLTFSLSEPSEAEIQPSLAPQGKMLRVTAG